MGPRRARGRATTAGDRRRFSVAHELGHLVLHQGPAGPSTPWAAGGLPFAAPSSCPSGHAAGARAPSTLTTLAELKARWGCRPGPHPTGSGTRVPPPSQYRSLSAQLGRGWRTREPVAVPVERPRALRQLAELLYGVPIDYLVAGARDGLTRRSSGISWRPTPRDVTDRAGRSGSAGQGSPRRSRPRTKLKYATVLLMFLWPIARWVFTRVDGSAGGRPDWRRSCAWRGCPPCRSVHSSRRPCRRRQACTALMGRFWPLRCKRHTVWDVQPGPGAGSPARW
jgi:hypothetical protein